MIFGFFIWIYYICTCELINKKCTFLFGIVNFFTYLCRTINIDGNHKNNNMAKKYHLKTHTTQTVDVTTGELTEVETKKEFTTQITKDHFYMTFIDFISPMFSLKSDTAKSVLTYMCSIAEYNTGKVALTTAKRNELCTLLGIRPNSLSNALTMLKEHHMITGERGEFQINAAIFWKGDSKTRSEIVNTDEFQITFGYKEKE